jgi:hypothetical protein
MFGVSSLASGKERNILSMLSMLANTPWFQFNPLHLMNANKGVFGVNVGHMWDEIDRLREWGETLMELAVRGIVRPNHFIQDRRNIGKVLLVPQRRETRFA